jgi:hypothetical protein
MRRFFLALALLVALSPAARAQCAATHVPVRVYLMYGLVSAVMSSGMGDLVSKLNRIKGVTASVHEWGEWSALASKAADTKAAIVFGGHSIGANVAVSAARQLNGKRKVALLLGFDPTRLSTLEPVPSNVVRAIGFRQDTNPFGGNMLVGSAKTTSVSNIFRDMNHIAIDKSDEIHAIAIRAVCSISSI